MKCTKCKKDNSYKAIYCYNCGNKFTKEEIEKNSKSKGIEIFKKVKNIYDIITLDKLKGSNIYRTIIILIMLIYAFWGIYRNGYKLKIKSSDNYAVEYNKNSDEYYLFTSNDKTNVNLYILGTISNVDCLLYDIDNNLIEENSYNNVDDIVLNSNKYTDNYYIIKTNKDSLKVFVYYKEEK